MSQKAEAVTHYLPQGSVKKKEIGRNEATCAKPQPANQDPVTTLTAVLASPKGYNFKPINLEFPGWHWLGNRSDELPRLPLQEGNLA